jgi:hypothetical protein
LRDKGGGIRGLKRQGRFKGKRKWKREKKASASTPLMGNTAFISLFLGGAKNPLISSPLTGEARWG